jgi:hypothetical protein
MNSTRFARIPDPCCEIFLQEAQVYRKSVFFVLFAPVRLNFEIAGFEYLPNPPTPRATPRNRARYLDPRLRELGVFFLF